ncbi:hypothetical protein [Nocardia sp. NPDC050710]|uniref:Rv0361 family membrane protein n=1 Tax=Nocardia sp. NPDC050710 TaxID=3157220 RepID=UPI0033D897E7
MRVVPAAGAGPAQAEEQPIAGADDKTVAMPIVPNPADMPTMAMPIQIPPDQRAAQRKRTSEGQQAGTDRVVPPGSRPGPLSKPPTTPRPAPGPKQPGPQGPTTPQGPGPHDEVEETRPTQPRPPAKPRPSVPQAQSPADVQMTLPVQSLNNPPGGPHPPQQRPLAPPQRIAAPAPAPSDQLPADAPAGGRSKRWLLMVGAAGVVLVAVLAAVVFALSGNPSSPEAKVRAAISDYTDALRDGDLATLRSSTCGPLHDFYANIPDDQFAGVHRLSMERKNIPVVDSVDAIQITGDNAIAQATVYTEADPSKRSARTFDLQHTADGWKVCDPPNGTP